MCKRQFDTVVLVILLTKKNKVSRYRIFHLWYLVRTQTILESGVFLIRKLSVNFTAVFFHVLKPVNSVDYGRVVARHEASF